MRRKGLASMAAQTVASTTNSTPAANSVDLGPAAALSCRECGHRVPLGPVFACEECFGPLEIAYDFSAYDAEELRKRIEAGPANIWRYAPLLPVPADVADKPNINPGWTKLVQADNLARELGVDAGKLFVKDDSGNPTHSFKDRVVAQAIEAAARSTSPLSPAPPPAISRARWAPPPRVPASGPVCSSRTTWSRARSSWPRSTAASSSASRATTTT
jgi:threonine synthase